jgi:3-oxoacyl-[acyl-carrier-protein] synthase II
MGVVSALGSAPDTFRQAILNGRSGVSPITSFDVAHYPTRIAGEIPNFNPSLYFDRKSVDRVDRFAQFAIAAAGPALQDSGIAEDDPRRRDIGVIVGTGLGGIQSNDAQFKTMYTRGPRLVSPMAIPMIMYNAAASHIAMRFGLRGPNLTITTACSSSSNAIGEAFRSIKHGYTEIMVAGGSDAPITPGILAAWCALRALSIRNDRPETACRPFSADRDGLVLAEGAAMLVLESLESASARSAPIYGEIVGYGSNGDGFHITQPRADSEAAAIKMALEEADVATDDVDYVSAHGTGTPLNDRTETAALKQVFDARTTQVPVSSLKSMLGHHMGAAGAFQVIAILQMMAAGMVHPTVNYMAHDPECDIDCVPNKARSVTVNVALANSFGFGGNNAVLVVRKWSGSPS